MCDGCRCSGEADEKPHRRMSRLNRQQILGWSAVGLSTALTCLWAFWGIIENFHEGWYQPTLLGNLSLMLGQYLIAMIVFLAFALIGLKWPKIGGALHVIFGCSLPVWFIRNNAGALFLSLPMVVLGILYWFGNPEPRKWAYRAVIAVPLAVLLVSGAEPAWRVSRRIDDGNPGARIVNGNGLQLVFAPRGPGWPESGVSWRQAMDICSHLSADGKTVSDSALNIWHLPNADELVRCATRGNANCGGVWDSVLHVATYHVTPDKESPLWDTHSAVIYWWTSTTPSDSTALIYVYNGALYPRLKGIKPGYLAFRAVRPNNN